MNNENADQSKPLWSVDDIGRHDAAPEPLGGRQPTLYSPEVARGADHSSAQGAADEHQVFADLLEFIELYSNRWDGQHGKHPWGIVQKARAIIAARASRPTPAQDAADTVQVGLRVTVCAGALEMVRNALKRDAVDGWTTRGEMLAALDATIAPAPQVAPTAAQPATTAAGAEPDVDEINELAQFIRWANGSHKTGAASLAEKILQWQAARAPQAERPPVPAAEAVEPLTTLTEDEMYTAIEDAARAYKRHQTSGPRGQMLSAADDPQTWIVGAGIKAFCARNHLPLAGNKEGGAA